MADKKLPSWEESAFYVGETLKRLETKLDGLDEKVNGVLIDVQKEIRDLSSDVAGLKIKSSYWGAIGGMVPVLVGLLVWLVKSVQGCSY